MIKCANRAIIAASSSFVGTHRHGPDRRRKPNNGPPLSRIKKADVIVRPPRRRGLRAISGLLTMPTSILELA